MTGIFLQVTADDVPYLPLWKKHVLGGRAYPVPVSTQPPVAVAETVMKAKEKGCSRVATCCPQLLKLLLGSSKKVSVHDYAGSLIESRGIEFLIVPPPEQLVTVNSGIFLAQRYFSKFLQPDKFIPLPPFQWTLWQDTAQVRGQVKYWNAVATFIAVDIETVRDDDDRSIDCIGFSFAKLNPDGNTYSLFNLVVPLDDEANLHIVRTILSSSPAKVLQNGKYDIAYLLRYGMPPVNYAFDTLNLFHSWYSELPKRLDFITAFMLRKWKFWKDDAKGSVDRMQHFEYNARDCYTTAMCFIALMREMPEWAINNFKMEFPVVYPAIMAENRGIVRDNEFMTAEEKRFLERMKERRATLGTMVDNPLFNPQSWQQVVALFDALGSGDIQKSGKVEMDKVANRHPLNARLIAEIKGFREDLKLVSSYLRDENEETGERKTWNGRAFFTLNPHGTDTGRLASGESHFWCGWNIQNIPRDRDDIQIKHGFVSDPGFYFGECDRSQAETRDTAYLSGDTKLIAVVDDPSKDFHGYNASDFFGIPYERIVRSQFDDGLQEWVHKTLDKPIRDLSKRTNHGANYNMMAQMLLNTMTIANVAKAQRLLNLPREWRLVDVTAYLLKRFDETYPTVRGDYYDWIRAQIAATKMLVGPTGWTRYCFGNPSLRKLDMNAYAAHPSQSLNAMELNTAYLRVFREVALPNPKDFKLGPQIHDSILFQYRRGRQDLVYNVARCMDNPIEVTDIFGVTRLLRIPVDIKGEAERWSDVKTMRMPKQ